MILTAIAVIWVISLASLALTLPSDFWAKGAGDQRSEHLRSIAVNHSDNGARSL